MTCREFLHQLNAMADGGEPAAALREHAQECPDCARRLAADALLRDGLRSMRDAAANVNAPLGFARAARRRAEAQRQAPRFTWPIAAGVALAAGVLGAAMLVVALGQGPKAPSSIAATSATAPLSAASATPVMWSNGGVDIVGDSNPGGAHGAGPSDASRAADAPAPQVAVLVEWNL